MDKYTITRQVTVVPVFCFLNELLLTSIFFPRCWVIYVVSILNSSTYVVSSLFIRFFNTKRFDFLIFMLNVSSYIFGELCMCLLFYYLTKCVRELFIQSRRLEVQKKRLRKEKVKTTFLLGNVLFQEYVPKIMRNEMLVGSSTCEIETFRNCGLFQADIVSFTKWCSAMESSSVVMYLNKYFSFFDSACEYLGVHKLRTVGDCFVAFSTTKTNNDDQEKFHHLDMIVLFAVSVLESFKYVSSLYADTKGLQIRAGCCFGDVVASVFGSIETGALNFDLYGKSMNELTSLESTSRPGSIQCSKDIYERTRNVFVFESSEATDLDDEDGHFFISMKGGANAGLCGERVVRCVKLQKTLRDVFRLLMSKEAQNDSTPVYKTEIDSDRGTSLSASNTLGNTASHSGSGRNTTLSGNESCGSEITRGDIYVRTGRRKRAGVGAVKWARKASRYLKSCLMSKDGNIRPLLLFNKLSTEIKFQKSKHADSKQMFLSFFLLQIALLLIYLIYHVIVKPEVFSNPTPYLITACVAICFNFFCVLLFISVRVLYKSFLVAFVASSVSTALLFALVVCLTIENDFYTSADVICFHIAFQCFFVLFQPHLHPTIRFLLYCVILGVFMVYEQQNLENYVAVGYDMYFILVIDLNLIAMIYVCCLICSFMHEYLLRRNFENIMMLNRKNSKMADDISMNNRLISCVIPQRIMALLYKNGFQSFSKDTQSFICFLKVSNVEKYFDDEVESSRKCINLVKFIGRLFFAFDTEIFKSADFTKIKTCQNVYMFVRECRSAYNDLDGEMKEALVEVLSLLSKFHKLFRDLSLSLKKHENELLEEEEDSTDLLSLGLKVGVNLGRVSSGVLGTTKFAYDVFGDNCNLCSSKDYFSHNTNVLIISKGICVASKCGKISMNYDALRGCLEHNPRVRVNEVVSRHLKGKGNINIADVSLREANNVTKEKVEVEEEMMIQNQGKLSEERAKKSEVEDVFGHGQMMLDESMFNFSNFSGESGAVNSSITDEEEKDEIFKF